MVETSREAEAIRTGKSIILRKVVRGKVVIRRGRRVGGGVQRPLVGGGSVIVTESGLVTIKDNGKTKEQFRTTPKQARRFVARGRDIIERGAVTKREVPISKEVTDALQERTFFNIRGTIIPQSQINRFNADPSISKVTIDGKTFTRRDLQRLGLVKRPPAGVIQPSPKPKLKERLGIALTKLDVKREERAKELRKRQKKFGPLAFFSGSRIEKPIDVALFPFGKDIRLGVVSGVGALAALALSPKEKFKAFVQAVRPKNIVGTGKALVRELERNPVSVITEFAIFNRGLGAAGKALKRNPIGRAVSEEIFIFRNVPKELRSPIRKILKAAKAQEGIKPVDLSKIKGVDFKAPASMTKVEFKAAIKALRKDKSSVVFGSAATRVLSKDKTPKAKDLDIATTNIPNFVKEFIDSLPKAQRGNYIIKRQKVFRVGSKQALFDVKPLDRLIPRKSILTGRGQLPVAGIKKTIEFLKKKKKRAFPELKKPVIKEKVVEDVLQVPTQKLVEIEGIRFVSFGEQTTRKALGTLQVILEKNVRRIKDPEALLIGLKVQVASLKRTKPKTPIGKFRTNSKIKRINAAIRLLEGKALRKFLEVNKGRIPKRLSKVRQLSIKKLRSVNKRKVSSGVKKELSKLPSRLPSKLPSKLPLSKIPLSRIPVSRVPPSRLLPSKVPISRVPLSKIPFSRLIPSKTPISRVPVSKVPISKIPVTKKKIVKKPFIKFTIKDLTKIRRKRVKGKAPQKLRFTPTIVRPRKIRREFRLFTGAELR